MYQIRKCRIYFVRESTEVINLDPEKFRAIGYSGNSDKEFFDFFVRLDYYDIKDNLDEQTINELCKIEEDCEWVEYSNSLQKGEESWYELGIKNEDFRKNGNFETLITDENY
jgi:hypothetical protein